MGTVAPSQQLGGVIMGRLVNAQEVCSRMKDFKESVANIFRHAMWRRYPRRLLQTVWSRFVFHRWLSTDVRVKVPRVWFNKVWSYLQKTDGSHRPDQVLPLSGFCGSHERIPACLRSACLPGAAAASPSGSR